jgi:hypothetical protein
MNCSRFSPLSFSNSILQAHNCVGKYERSLKETVGRPYNEIERAWGFEDLEKKTNVKLFAILETSIQSKIRNSHYGNKHKGKDNASSEIHGSTSVQTHAYVLYRSPAVAYMRNVNDKHSSLILFPVVNSDLQELYFQPVMDVKAALIEKHQQTKDSSDHVGSYMFSFLSQLVKTLP